MPLGLGAQMGKGGVRTPSHVTSNLKMLHRYNAGAVVPVSDGAAYIDGDGDYIYTNATFQSTFRGSHSICMWVKPIDGNPSGTEYFLGSKNNVEGVAEDRVYFALLADGKVKYRLEGNADGDDLTSSTVFTDGVQDWTHLAITALKDEGASNGFKLYVNGVLHSQADSSAVSDANWAAFETDIELDLGAYNENGSHTNSLDGYMCNVGIFSAVLTQAQIKSIMWKNYAGLTTGTGSESENLVSWYNLDEGTGTTATDSHGSNNGSATFS